MSCRRLVASPSCSTTLVTAYSRCCVISSHTRLLHPGIHAQIVSREPDFQSSRSKNLQNVLVRAQTQAESHITDQRLLLKHHQIPLIPLIAQSQIPILYNPIQTPQRIRIEGQSLISMRPRGMVHPAPLNSQKCGCHILPIMHS
jgi:hypothetical protein